MWCSSCDLHRPRASEVEKHAMISSARFPPTCRKVGRSKNLAPSPHLLFIKRKWRSMLHEETFISNNQHVTQNKESSALNKYVPSFEHVVI